MLKIVVEIYPAFVISCICMNTITIPKELSQKGDLVVVPRKEYEILLELREIVEFTPTASQKKALKRAEKNLRNKKSLSYNEVLSKLGFKN